MCNCTIDAATVLQVVERACTFTGCPSRKLPREAGRLSTWAGLAAKALWTSTSLPVRIIFKSVHLPWIQFFRLIPSGIWIRDMQHSHAAHECRKYTKGVSFARCSYC